MRHYQGMKTQAAERWQERGKVVTNSIYLRLANSDTIPWNAYEIYVFYPGLSSQTKELTAQSENADTDVVPMLCVGTSVFRPSFRPTFSL